MTRHEQWIDRQRCDMLFIVCVGVVSFWIISIIDSVIILVVKILFHLC